MEKLRPSIRRTTRSWCEVDRWPDDSSAAESRSGSSAQHGRRLRVACHRSIWVTPKKVYSNWNPTCFWYIGNWLQSYLLQLLCCSCNAIVLPSHPKVPADSDGHFRARRKGAVGCHWAFGSVAHPSPGGRLWGGSGVETGRRECETGRFNGRKTIPTSQQYQQEVR